MAGSPNGNSLRCARGGGSARSRGPIGIIEPLDLEEMAVGVVEEHVVDPIRGAVIRTAHDRGSRIAEALRPAVHIIGDERDDHTCTSHCIGPLAHTDEGIGSGSEYQT